jgi:hypothetical protein
MRIKLVVQMVSEWQYNANTVQVSLKQNPCKKDIEAAIRFLKAIQKEGAKKDG